MGEVAWTYLDAVASAHEFIGIAETHVPESQLRKWDARARGAGLRLMANPARPSGRHKTDAFKDRANEGGEWILAQGHRRAETLLEAQSTAALRAPGSAAIDGFMVSTTHFSGFSIVLCVCYGLTTLGLAGRNLARFHRLGGLLRSLHLPWTCLGDWNVEPHTIIKSGSLDLILGRIITPEGVSYTCDASKLGSMLDYAIVSEAAIPYIHSLHPVFDTPWRPHIGISMSIRSHGQQLLTRRLVCPSRLPQVARPCTLPVPGSKSSAAKLEKKANAEIARAIRIELC